MIELTTQEIFDLRKAILEKFGLTQQADDIWFKHLLPNIQLRRLVEKRQKEFCKEKRKEKEKEKRKLSYLIRLFFLRLFIVA